MLADRLIISSLLVSSIGLCSGFGDEIPPYDTVIFAQRWSRSECCVVDPSNITNPNCSRCHTSKQIQPKWSISGLWPSDTIHLNNVAYCPNPLKYIKFNRFPTNILLTMREHWPDVTHERRDKSFWWQQWVKYGTCIRDINGMETDQDYFRKAVGLFDWYRAERMLSGGSIIHGNYYTSKVITQSFENSLNRVVTIKCENRYGISYLHSIRLCFDKAWQLKNCTSATNCHSIIYYP